MITIPEHIGTHPLIPGQPPHDMLFRLHEDAVTQGFAILAMRDSGKSNLAGVMQEEFARRGDQFIVIDPVAAHIGIRNAADPTGSPAGPSGIQTLIVGGKNGDCPLPTDRGRELAQVLMETKMSCVIDLKAARAAERKNFLTDFGEELYSKNETPLHLFIEEADEVIPQQPDNREESAIRHIWRKIVKGGRSSGLGFTIISQRAAMVDKSSLYQIDNLLVMALMGGGDLKTVEDWLKFHVKDKARLKEIMESIPNLKRGETWFLSPRWLKQLTQIQVRRRVTFHAGKTPKRGEAPAPMQRYELGEVAERFKEKLAEKDALEQSQVETTNFLFKVRDDLEAKLGDANDKVDELTGQLGDANDRIEALESAVKDAAEAAHSSFRTGQEQGYRRGYSEGYRAAQESTLKLLQEMQNMQPVTIVVPQDIAVAEALTEECVERITRPAVLQWEPTGKEQRQNEPPAEESRNRRSNLRYSDIERVATKHVPSPIVPPTASNGISRPQMALIAALAELEAIGLRSAKRSVLAFTARVSSKSSGFEKNVSTLSSHGAIEYPSGGYVRLTDKGREIAKKHGYGSHRMTGRELITRVKGIISAPQGVLLDVLVQAYPKSLSRADLARLAGVSAASSGYEKNVSTLSSFELITYPQQGHVRAAEWMFIR